MVKNVALPVNSKPKISFFIFLFAKTARHSFVCWHNFIDFVCERFPSKSLSMDLYKMMPRQISKNYVWERFLLFFLSSSSAICKCLPCCSIGFPFYGWVTMIWTIPFNLSIIAMSFKLKPKFRGSCFSFTEFYIR